jgi:hypothetical protein
MFNQLTFKRVFAIVLCIALLCGLSACSDADTQAFVDEIGDVVKDEIGAQIDGVIDNVKDEIGKQIDGIIDGASKAVDDLTAWVTGLFSSMETAKVPGKLIFLQHGLNDGLFFNDSGEATAGCFTIMVNELCKGKYIDFGYISMRTETMLDEYNKDMISELKKFDLDAKTGRDTQGYTHIQDFARTLKELNIAYTDSSSGIPILIKNCTLSPATPNSIEFGSEYWSIFSQNSSYDISNPEMYFAEMIDALTKDGYNVLVRTEFSAGNLSFDYQLRELDTMVNYFEGHSANVVFIGHSMGGLVSTNYGTDYAENHPDKEVQIITVDTPYLKNKYAEMAYNYPIMANDQNKITGSAHRDLAALPDETGNYVALEGIRQKWNSKSEMHNITLYAIAVSINEYDKIADFMGIGDGVVDVYSQQGNNTKNEPEWHNVNRQDVIWGKSTWNMSSIQASIWDSKDPYHHCNTPQLKEVREQIDALITG